jgi:hypothetical protein
VRIEPGKYLGRITDYGILEATEAGKYDQVFIEFDVIGRYDPATGQLQGCPPEARTYYKSTHPNSVDWLIADLKILGYDKPSFRFLDPEVEGAVDWFKKEVAFTCDHDTSMDGTLRERWLISRGRTRKKAKAEALARLDARLADKLKKAFGGAAPPAAPLTAPDTTDEPF